MRPSAALKCRTPRLALAAAGLLMTTSCGGGSSADVPTDELDSSGISAQIQPQIAAVGEEPEAADDAAYVVDARVKGAGEGTEVELQVGSGSSWEVEETATTNGDGVATLVVPSGVEAFRVVAGDEGEATGVELTTADAPPETYRDEFDKRDTKAWATRDQGYTGVRLCSKASDEAAEWVDGVLRLSVLDDPDKGTCTVKGKKYDYRLNGHVGGTYGFTYGHAAARIKFQPERGQHGSFWMQGFGPKPTGDAKFTGAEIDVIEYFGDDHPDGGLSSFVYWHPTAKGKIAGGWLPKPEQYGDDWSSKFHVFSVEWTPEKYVFRIDGQITNTITQGVSGQPEFLILSLLSSDYELQHLEDDDKLPQHMDVDWVRVWAQP